MLGSHSMKYGVPSATCEMVEAYLCRGCKVPCVSIVNHESIQDNIGQILQSIHVVSGSA